MSWAQAIYGIFDDLITGLVILGVFLALFTDFWENLFMLIRNRDDEDDE